MDPRPWWLLKTEPYPQSAEQTLGTLASRDKEKVYQMRLRDEMG